MARMTKAERKRKKEYAESLYVDLGMTQKAVAQKVEVTESTISAWRAEGNWDELRASKSISKANEYRRLLMQLNSINDSIESREINERFPNSKEADIISKLGKAIKDLENEQGISETVNVFQAFLTFLKAEDFDSAQLFNKYADAYIKSLLK